jgi:hypothetical protein
VEVNKLSYRVPADGTIMRSQRSSVDDGEQEGERRVRNSKVRNRLDLEVGRSRVHDDDEMLIAI